MSIMDPLREEHAGLLPHIDGLRTAADEVGAVPLEELKGLVADSFRFLVHHLIPHATAEDKVLYPVVERVMGAPGATATMSRDHVEVDRLTHDLSDLQARLDEPAGLSGYLACDLRRVLYGLYALVSVHFAKEEELYVPLLESRLTAEEAGELFRRMEEVAGTTHHPA
ncbi:MAG TPA: hemerythrin domain-containing protein [Acidimicrobiales bacterium]|nr:hemerythrin domain-containing protein [Acidimicrobiales bacterium]